MSSTKTRVKWAVMAKVESTYGTAIALTAATDGVQATAEPTVKPDMYLHDGTRGKAAGSAGDLPNVAASGLGFEASLVMEPVGAGAAYSAGVVPPGVHTALSICGIQPTGSFGAGVETYTYAPESGPTGFDSATVEIYLNGQKYPGAGVYGTFNISGVGPSVPVWQFDLKGIGTALPTDASIPVLTYPPATRLPPKAVNITFSLGTGTPFTAAKVREFHFTLNRDLSPRGNQNGTTTAHAGFTPGKRNVQFEITVEQTALAVSNPWYTASTLNPYGLKQDRNMVALALTVGSVQYNRYVLSMAQAQLLTVEDTADGNTSLWHMVFTCPISTPNADDDFSILFS